MILIGELVYVERSVVISPYTIVHTLGIHGDLKLTNLFKNLDHLTSLHFMFVREDFK